MSSLRQIRYFLRIAELGSFTAAADALFLAQPALSRQIAQLEESLGFELFERLPRGVRLTPAGEMYRARMSTLIDQLEEAAEAGRDVALGRGGILRLLHSSSLPVPTFLPWMQRLLAETPRLQIDLDRQSSELQLAALMAGQADLGLVRLPLLRRVPGIALKSLPNERLSVLMSAQHPWAGRAALQLSDLKDEPFVSAVHRERGGLARRVADLCLKRGFVPRLSPVISRKTAMLDLVAAGFGIAVVPSGLAKMASAACVVCPLVDEDAYAEAALAIPNAPSALALRFVEAVFSQPSAS